MATNLILARRLGPADFGVVSFAMTLIGALALLQDLGVPDAIIRSPRDIREIGGTALAINVAGAVLLFLLTALVSPVLAEFGHNQAIAPITVALAAGLIVTSFGSVHDALLTRSSAFGLE